MKSNKIEIEIPDGKKAEWVNGVLTLVDAAPEKPKNVMERIKTLHDAVQELGEDNPLVIEFEEAEQKETITPDLLAYMKLRVICAALNEGWQPTFGKDEWRYWPWFYIYSKKELDEMSEEERSRVVGRSNNNSVALGGLVYASAFNASSNSGTLYGSRLAFKSEELAVYCGRQFIDIWADYIC